MGMSPREASGPYLTAASPIAIQAGPKQRSRIVESAARATGARTTR
jgi:hypothetical protein